MQQGQKTLDELIDFLNSSPTAWHAVANVKSILLNNGFSELLESDAWKLKKGGRYFVTRNNSTLCAFVLPKNSPESACIIASHTDSPAFKLRPNTEYRKENMVMLGVEVYGAPLLTSWLNRDLGIAGRVMYSNKQEKILESLVNITNYPLTIPQLAIHLDRKVNEEGLTLNKQDHLSALACLEPEKSEKGKYLENILKEQVSFNTLLGFDLFLYPLEPARYLGNGSQMIASYRIDSLCSVHSATTALMNSLKPAGNSIKMTLFCDNEEIGSGSAQGAESPFLSHLLERILFSLGGGREDYFRLLNRSLCISVDLGHALHPNYPEKHDPRHQPLLNKGILLKSNAQQRYATDARSSALIVTLAKQLNIPIQYYTNRGDIACGSTIGPINATQTGIATVDLGIPQLSMHSCRELIECQDHLHMCRLLQAALEGTN